MVSVLASSSVLHLEADAHPVDADLCTLNRYGQSVECLLQGHVAICFLLQFVARLYQGT